MKKIMVFDCESTSLHGPTFAVGGVIITIKGHSAKIERSFSVIAEEKLDQCCPWVKENALPVCKKLNHVSTRKEMRDEFYKFMHSEKFEQVLSDVNFPVETNFLTSIVLDDIKEREFNMPYPLYDISTLVSVEVSRSKQFHEWAGMKLEEHNPLHDAIASAFMYLRYMGIDLYVSSSDLKVSRFVHWWFEE